MRPAEVELLVGNPIKAKQKLGWETKTSFEELVRIMVDAEIRFIEKT
jgi:GDPmannose 4,6-dehydratase